MAVLIMKMYNYEINSLVYDESFAFLMWSEDES